jgi:uncharacterized protein YegP (UPF0339 family)
MRRSKYEKWQNGDRFFWRLRSSNGKVICSGQSVGYSSASARDKGIRANRRTALTAKTLDIGNVLDIGKHFR